MRRILIAAMQAALIGCSPAAAQVGGVGIPTPGIAATSPLGMTPGSSVAPTGIPMGATELASPGLSPATNGTIGMTGFVAGTTCSATGSPSSGMSGSSTNFDGGGVGTGTGTSLPGSSAICGTSSSSSASSAPTMSPTSPGGIARTGIPMGSVEVGSAGVSPLVVVPVPSSPSLSSSLSTMGTIPSPSTIGTPSPSSSMVGTPNPFPATTRNSGPCSATGPVGPNCNSRP